MSIRATMPSFAALVAAATLVLAASSVAQAASDKPVKPVHAPGASGSAAVVFPNNPHPRGNWCYWHPKACRGGWHR